MSNEIEKILPEDKVAPAETAASKDEAPENELPENELPENELPENELNAARWAVIGAGDRTVRHLTYEQAIECRNVLDAEGIFGLVIVTDETAERVLAAQVGS